MSLRHAVATVNSLVNSKYRLVNALPFEFEKFTFLCNFVMNP